MLRPATLADALLGSCHCLAGALLHTGRARYVTGYLHRHFLRHAEHIGYRFQPLVADEHPANGPFVPVIASLREYEQLLARAPAGSHLAGIRSEYRRVCAAAAVLGTDDW